VTGEVTRASTSAAGGEANSGSVNAAFSPDGTKIMFQSDASNLVAGDTNRSFDIFVKDLLTGGITRVSTSATGAQGEAVPEPVSMNAVFTSDGTKIVFQSTASNLVPGDTNSASDIFVKSLTDGAITRVSTTASGGQSNHHSERPVISPDGTKVAFRSTASNLVAGDTNGRDDVFVKDLATGTITRISTSAAGAEGDWNSDAPAFSPDGRKVVFISGASTLVPGDTNGTTDVFVRDLPTGAIERVSVSTSGAEGNSMSNFNNGFSSDGSRILLSSDASNLVAADTNYTTDVFIAQQGFAYSNLEKTTAVATLTATDRDAGSSLAWSISGTDAARFTIDAATGVLRFSNAPTFLSPADQGADNVYDIQVSISDGLFTTTAPARITVTQQPNTAPSDISLSTTSIAENAGANAVVGTLSTTDPDAGDTFTYSLVAGTGSTDNAAFSISGGKLLAASSFNYEAKSSYSVRIRSTDQRGLSTEKAFAIKVTDVNEAPTVVALTNTTTSLPESTSTASRLKVADIAVTDDALGTNAISLSGTDAASFEVVGTGLYLKAGVVLNASLKPAYGISVQATDPSLPSATPVTAAFKLSVTDSGVTVPGGQTTTDTATHSGSYQLLKQGGGTLILDKPNTHSGGTVIEAGTIIVKDASALGTGEVRIKAGATLVIDPAAGEAVAGSLVIEEGGFVDLGTGRIRIVAGMTATALVDALLSGKGDGSWTMSAGIGSSAVSAAVGMGTLRTIGWLDNGDGSFTAGFAAQGDTTMDGAVDILDASNFVTSAKYDTGLYTSWVDGDFNHDGVLDILDATDFFNSALFDQGIYLVSASAPAAMSAMEPVAATAGSATASAIDSAFAALASDTTATPTKRKNPFASFR
jgi:autotransporter-associated beta strand protein